MKRLIVPLLAAAVLQVGCRETRPRPNAPYPRIVSYSPAITDMLFEMGLGDHVVAVTRKDILPPGESRKVVGDALYVDCEAIVATDPDLVLTQVSKGFGAVRKLDPDIHVEHLRIESLNDITAAMTRIGQLAGKPDRALEATARFLADLRDVGNAVQDRPRPRVLFALEYQNPFVPGKGTFIDEMISRAGGVNAGDPASKHPRWRNMDIEEIIAARPEVIVCQVPPGREHDARNYWLNVPDLPAAKAGRIHIVTDRRWTIPSTRSAKFARQLVGMIHPDTVKGNRPNE